MRAKNTLVFIVQDTLAECVTEKNLLILFFSGTCRNGVCIGFCENRGQLPCICSDASGNSCKRCCKITEDSPCTPYLGAGLLPDGQICLSGFCKQVCIN